jgi:CRP/FNR family cyclic AMP-dependent transcriptional regulator
MLEMKGGEGMKKIDVDPFDIRAFIVGHGGGSKSKREAGQAVYLQGDPSDAVFYLIGGTVKISIHSESGKEAVVGLIGPGNFFGERCLAGERDRATTVKTVSACEIARFGMTVFTRALDEDSNFSKVFMRFLLDLTERLQIELEDQLFNSSEKRLARILLTLADAGQQGQSGSIALDINQETLARMVGTTRPRINSFMNKFRNLGYIDYHYNSRIQVRNSLEKVLLHHANAKSKEKTSDNVS